MAGTDISSIIATTTNVCTWHYVRKEARVLSAAASKPVGYSAGKKDVATRSQDRLLSLAEKSEFSIEHIKRFVFRVVKMVRRRERRGRREMNERIGYSC